MSASERRASYEVILLAVLPDDGIAIEGQPDGSCGCYWCRAADDWRAIACASVRLLTSGVDPLETALDGSEEPRQLTWRDRDLLCSLFAAPIVKLRGAAEFMDGRHRVHALRMAGAEWCVVYTGRGERPDQEAGQRA